MGKTIESVTQVAVEVGMQFLNSPTGKAAGAAVAGTVGGAALVTGGAATVTALGVGAGVATKGLVIMAGAANTAATIPVVGTAVSSGIATVASGALTAGVALGSIAVIAVPAAACVAIGVFIGRRFRSR